MDGSGAAEPIGANQRSRRRRERTRRDDGTARRLARGRLPPAFERWRLVLPAGESRATHAGEWARALVLVESGTIEAYCHLGGRCSFGQGDLLALGWLPVHTLHNPGGVEARLVAVRRRRATGDVDDAETDSRDWLRCPS